MGCPSVHLGLGWFQRVSKSHKISRRHVAVKGPDTLRRQPPKVGVPALMRTGHRGCHRPPSCERRVNDRRGPEATPPTSQKARALSSGLGVGGGGGGEAANREPRCICICKCKCTCICICICIRVYMYIQIYIYIYICI